MNKKSRILLSILLVAIVSSIVFLSYIIAVQDTSVVNKADGADAYSCSQELIDLVGEENIDKVLVKAIVEEGFSYNKYACSKCGAIYNEKINNCSACGFEVFASDEEKIYINNDKELTLAELESIKCLEIENYKNITNLSILGQAKNLESLSIQNCGIDNNSLATLLDKKGNSVLANCPSLSTVDFKYNKINNIDNINFTDYQATITQKVQDTETGEEQEVQSSLLNLVSIGTTASFNFSSQYIEEDNSPEITFEDETLKNKLISHPIMGKYDIAKEQIKYFEEMYVDQNNDGKITVLELNQLEEIYLPSQEITSLVCFVNETEYGLLELVPELLSVDLRHNNIEKTGGMSGLVVEDYINLSNNKITSIENFQEISNVSKIDLSYNNIESIITKREVEDETNTGFTTYETVGIKEWQCYSNLKELDIQENYVDIYSIETDETGNLVKTITLERLEDAIAGHENEELIINYKPQKVLAANDFALEGLDSNLEKLLKKALKGDENSDAFVGKKEILRLTSLNVNSYENLEIDKISSLSGLEYAANLQTLILDNQNISDLSPIANLQNLKEVNLENNVIDDLSKLLVNNELKLNLTKLNISKNYLNREKNVDNSMNLNVLAILKNAGTQVLDQVKYVGPIIDLNSVVNFEDINLKNAILTELGKEANSQVTREDLLKITEINLSNKNITNLSGIEFLGNCTKINLSNNNVTNIDLLAYCTNLQEINLSNCSLGDNGVNINSIMNLPKLR